MTFSLRVCRHCRKSVSLDAKRCVHCKKELMNPRAFKTMLYLMFASLIIVYGALFYGVLAYKSAYNAAYCHQSIYERRQVPADATCVDLCTAACQAKGAASGSGTLLTTGYITESTYVQMSCECSCNGCFTSA